MKLFYILNLTASASIAATASADITGAYVISYSVTAADFDGSDVTVNIQDLYLASNDSTDTVLNTYNFMMADEGKVNYFQSFTGTGWQPTNIGGPFDTPALRSADSFVTIGGFEQGVLFPEQSLGAGSYTTLYPNFGGIDAEYPGENAGWYNGSPPSLNGAVGSVQGAGLGVLIGRFAYDGDFDIFGSTLEVTWTQGLGTPGDQAEFMVMPAPGALALLGLAGLSGRRRRG